MRFGPAELQEHAEVKLWIQSWKQINVSLLSISHSIKFIIDEFPGAQQWLFLYKHDYILRHNKSSYFLKCLFWFILPHPVWEQSLATGCYVALNIRVVPKQMDHPNHQSQNTTLKWSEITFGRESFLRMVFKGFVLFLFLTNKQKVCQDVAIGLKS